MIDLSQPIEIKYVDGGPRSVHVNWPSDELWCKRARTLRSEDVTAHDGSTERKPVGADEANLKLLAASGVVASGEAPEDKAAATMVVRRLEMCSTRHERVGADRLLITLTAWKREATHLVRIPRTKELRWFNDSRAIVKRKDSNTVVIRQRLEPAAELYDAVILEVAGYADPKRVPIIHKEAVLDEVNAAISAMLRDAEDDGPEVESPVAPMPTDGPSGRLSTSV